MIVKRNSCISLSILFFCVSYTAGATYTLKVDLSNKIRPVTHCASGSLYGITEQIPASVEEMIAPLKPCVFNQPAMSGPKHQHDNKTAAIPIAKRIAKTTAKVQIKLSDINRGWPYQWPGQAAWLDSVKKVINEKKASGLTNFDGYEIWNEPDGTWQAANGDFNTVCWKPTYDLIKSLDPDARIIGPGLSYMNTTKIKDFLTFCRDKKCLPEVICWHQWGSAGLVGGIQSYRQLESSLGISPRAITINEYSSRTSDPYEGCPGYSVPFIAKFERHGVESACISWWHTAYPGRLGSLLTPSNQKGGGWYLYKWYGDMTGQMVDITPPNDKSDGIDGFGCIDESQNYASICLGGNNTGTVNVVISGIPASWNKISVKVEYVPWVNKDSPVTGPVAVSTKSYTVSNGTITIPVEVTSILYGYHININSESTGLGSLRLENEKIKLVNLSQNGSMAHITINAAQSGNASVDIYDLKGNLVRTASFKTTAGTTHDYSFSTGNFPKGYYGIVIRSGSYVRKSGLLLTGGSFTTSD